MNIGHARVSGSVAVLSKYLNKAVSLQICKKYNWSVERHRVGSRALLQALCHYMLWAKIILVDFDLVVSTHQMFCYTVLPVTTIDASYLTVYFVAKILDTRSMFFGYLQHVNTVDFPLNHEVALR